MNINKRLEALNVSSKYGAPMGRRNIVENESASVYLQKVEFVDGDYDRGGAYWGGGKDSLPLWCAMDEDDVMIFVRANTKDQAKASILSDYPNLTFIESNDIDVDTFTREYLVAALWSSTDDDGDPFDEVYSLDDIAPETMSEAKAACQAFIDQNKDDLLAWDGNRYSVEEMGGHDLWLTQNRHGAGFWDGDWDKAVGKRLTENAHKLGEKWLYVGDDGLVYWE